MTPLRHSKTDNSRQAPSPDALAAARSLLLDAKASAAVEHLRAGGVPSILLKGRAIAAWLYDHEVRPYADVDLLVSPGHLERAMQLLAELGYVRPLTGAHPAEFSTTELELFDTDDVCVDLHRTLVGASASPERCWEVLTRRTVALRVGVTEVDVLDTPARTMHLALHAAQDGPSDRKAIADLERGLAKVERKHWAEAARVAEELGATEAFAAGLRLLPAGRVLAAELSLPEQLTVELAIRTRSATQDAIFFERFTRARGIRAKVALLARKLFPTSVYLRANHPIANRGALGLFVARLYRLVLLSTRLGPAVSAWHRARQLTRGIGPRTGSEEPAPPRTRLT